MPSFEKIKILKNYYNEKKLSSNNLKLSKNIKIDV